MAANTRENRKRRKSEAPEAPRLTAVLYFGPYLACEQIYNEMGSLKKWPKMAVFCKWVSPAKVRIAQFRATF